MRGPFERSSSEIVLTAPDSARGANLILIMGEAVQDFPIDLRWNGVEITPRLNAFARESIRCDSFYTQAAQGQTADAEFAVLNSLHPLPEGPVCYLYAGNRFHGLPRILSRHGYTTFSGHTSNPHFWNMRTIHRRYGFDTSVLGEEWGPGITEGWGLADREFLPRSADRLASLPEPFFAYLLTVSTHHPFRETPRDTDLHLGALEGRLAGDYLHAMRYLDGAFGAFWDRAQASGLADRSVVVFLGDHGGNLGMDPVLGERLGIRGVGEARWREWGRRVPLLVRLPRGAGAGRRWKTGGEVDLAPTLLSLLGVSPEKYPLLGRDLDAEDTGVVIFRDGSATDGSILYLPGATLGSGDCISLSTGLVVACGDFAARAQSAAEDLRVSDLAVRGDLIPEIGR